MFIRIVISKFATQKVSNAVHFYTADSDATDLAGNVGHSSNAAIFGSSKADTLVGTSGNDIIIGNAGNDNITGGGGADLLTGGSGKDIFIYNATADSTPANHDTITDFTHGQDKIDFTNIAGINVSRGVPTFQGQLTGSGDLTLNAHSVAYMLISGIPWFSLIRRTRLRLLAAQTLGQRTLRLIWSAPISILQARISITSD